MEKEVWKFYKGSCIIYEVSNYGRVKRNGVLVELDNSKKYLSCIGVGYIHRAVAELFVPNPDNKPQVDHIDTNRHNNKADNLRWVTVKENINNSLTRKHISEALKGRKSWNKGTKTPEHVRQKQSQSLKGKIKTAEHRKHLSESLKGKETWNKGYKYLNDGYLEVYVSPDYWGEFIDIGFKFGKLKR